MKISKNDPRLTAYVLNELDAAEKTIIEKALQADPELQAEVAEIKKSVVEFSKLALPEADMALSPAQREQIFAKAVPPASTSGWSLWTIGGSLATACLALVLFQQKAHEKRTEYVITDSAPVVKSVTAVNSQLAPKKSALAKEQVEKTEQARAELIAATDSFGADKPAAIAGAEAGAKVSEPHEFAKAENVGSGAFGGAASNYAARKVKDEASDSLAQRSEAAPAPAAPTPARIRLREMPLELDVSLSQFLPTETEPADVEINMNLTRDLKKCFSENLSKYVRYNLSFRLNWQIQKTKLVNAGITDLMGTGLITAEIRSCVNQAFEIQHWAEVKYIREALKPLKFEAVIKIVSE